MRAELVGNTASPSSLATLQLFGRESRGALGEKRGHNEAFMSRLRQPRWPETGGEGKARAL